ncbi:MAG: 50S ribosomal protein L29 [Gemmatimonadetes bacterium]|nr:50S ribosomal protein L29 [Gemmatimonadota bacterium]NIO30329.1 50S ribosomal protein L29 [Gemmatimonadota bacterium]
MRPEEIRELADADIERTIEELSDELFELRMKSAYEETENPMRVRQIRRDLARLKTIRRERELQAARDAKEK